MRFKGNAVPPNETVIERLGRQSVEAERRSAASGRIPRMVIRLKVAC
jgi:hypothetical protein